MVINDSKTERLRSLIFDACKNQFLEKLIFKSSTIKWVLPVFERFFSMFGITLSALVDVSLSISI